MTPKERMLVALSGGRPDRLPATVHQWQDYHLRTFMGGMTDVEAFHDVGLDAAITRSPFVTRPTPSWRVRSSTTAPGRTRHEIQTPDGGLSFETESNQYTSWITEHLIKNDSDVDLFAAHSPRIGLDKDALRHDYDDLGDAGILRTFIIGLQGGCWQDACELYGTEKLIMATFDKPDWVHHFLEVLWRRRSRSSSTT